MRIFATTSLLSRNRPESVKLEGIPRSTSACIESWCIANGVNIDLSPEISSPLEGERKTHLSSVASSVVFIIKTCLTFGLTKRRTPRSTDLTHVNYLIRFDSLDSVMHHYWGPLEKLEQDLGLTCRWLHIAVGGHQFRSGRQLRKTMSVLNRTTNAEHALLQSYLTPPAAWQAILCAIRVSRMGRSLWNHVDFRDPHTGVCLKPLVRRFWEESHFSRAAAANAIWLTTLFRVGHGFTRRWIYPMENQPWEMALLTFASENSCASTHGYIHATARVLDLRLHLPKSGPLDPKGTNPPCPTEVLVDSSVEARRMKDFGYPPESVHEVEALRFSTPGECRYVDGIGKISMLVIGEYDLACSLGMLSMVRNLPAQGVRVAFRPHPTAMIPPIYKSPDIEFTENTSLLDDLASCQLVLCMNTSTAVLVASELGIPILLALDGNILDGGMLAQDQVSRALPVTESLTAATLEEVLGMRSRPHAGIVKNRDTEWSGWRGWLSGTQPNFPRGHECETKDRDGHQPHNG